MKFDKEAFEETFSITCFCILLSMVAGVVGYMVWRIANRIWDDPSILVAPAIIGGIMLVIATPALIVGLVKGKKS